MTTLLRCALTPPLFDLAPHFHVSRCPPLPYGAVLSGLAMSTSAIWCHVVGSRVVHPCYMVPHCQVSRCPVSRFQCPLTWEVNVVISKWSYQGHVITGISFETGQEDMLLVTSAVTT